MAEMTVPHPIARDFLATLERARARLFERLEGPTGAEYHGEPAGDFISFRPGDDGVFRVASYFRNRDRRRRNPLRRSPGASGTSVPSAGAAMGSTFFRTSLSSATAMSGRAPRKRASKRSPSTGSISIPVSQTSAPSASWRR
jgi:hypothetical protein